MLAALAYLPAVLAIAVLLLRWRRTRAPALLLEAAAPAPATISGELDPLRLLDELLAELELATVRIEGADELDDGAVSELERLAARLEAAACSFEGVG